MGLPIELCEGAWRSIDMATIGSIGRIEHRKYNNVLTEGIATVDWIWLGLAWRVESSIMIVI